MRLTTIFEINAISQFTRFPPDKASLWASDFADPYIIIPNVKEIALLTVLVVLR